MDVNAGRIISDNASLDDIGKEIINTIEQVCSGQPCAAERLGHREFVLTYKAFDYSASRGCDA